MSGYLDLPNGQRRSAVCLSIFVFIALSLISSLSCRGSAPVPDYSGHYELADKKTSRLFTLDVKQIKRRAEVSFTAATAEGTGAAPTGSGKGEVEDGVLAFEFKDSFNNEGTCTLQPVKKGFELMMTVTKITDPRPFHFYGSVMLRKFAL